MVAWFVWMPSPKGPRPQVVFDEMDTATKRTAMSVVPMKMDDERSVRDSEIAYESLSERYPPPKLADE